MPRDQSKYKDPDRDSLHKLSARSSLSGKGDNYTIAYYTQQDPKKRLMYKQKREIIEPVYHHKMKPYIDRSEFTCPEPERKYKDEDEITFSPSGITKAERTSHQIRRLSSSLPVHNARRRTLPASITVIRSS